MEENRRLKVLLIYSSSCLGQIKKQVREGRKGEKRENEKEGKGRKSCGEGHVEKEKEEM